MSRLPVVLLAGLAACSDGGAAGELPVRAPGAVPATATIDTLPSSGSVFVGCGFLLAENHGSTHFTVLLRAEDARQAEHENGSLWLLDGVAVETQVADAASMGAPDARGEQLLRRHMEWETAYTAERNGWDALRPDPGTVDLGSGIPAMVWGYDTPTPLRVLGAEVTRVVYATAAVDDRVFVMSAPLEAGADPEQAARTIRRSLVTLRRSDHPVDLYALSAEVQREAPGPWSGCPRD